MSARKLGSTITRSGMQSMAMIPASISGGRWYFPKSADLIPNVSPKIFMPGVLGQKVWGMTPRSPGIF